MPGAGSSKIYLNYEILKNRLGLEAQGDPKGSPFINMHIGLTQ